MLESCSDFCLFVLRLYRRVWAHSAFSPGRRARDLVIKNATLLTATHGRIANGSVVVHGGKIAAFGAAVTAPAGAMVIDAGGKYVTPGLIDAHSHMALDDDVNEATSPIVPQMMMVDAFQYTSKEIYRALAGGVTSAMLLHGSADMIGGQAVIIKTKYGLGRDQLLFPNAPRSIKFASGENPKRVFGARQQLALHPHGQLRGAAPGPGGRAGLHAPVGRVRRQEAEGRQRRQDAEARPQARRAGGRAQRQALRADPLLSRRRIPDRDGDGERVRLQAARLPSRARGLQGRRQNRGQQCRRRHLGRLVGLQGGGLGRHAMERRAC